MGASFGGSSQTLFGTEGPVPLLNKITTAAAIIFMVTSLLLAILASNIARESVMSEFKAPSPAEQALPSGPIAVPMPDQPEGAAPPADFPGSVADEPVAPLEMAPTTAPEKAETPAAPAEPKEQAPVKESQ